MSMNTDKVDSIGKVCKILLAKKDVLQWNVDDVLQWLSSCGLEQFAANFKKLGIDGYALI